LIPFLVSPPEWSSPLSTMHLSRLLSAVPRYLMCRPTFFNVKYSINPWMDCSSPVDCQRAMDQWETLREMIENAGGKVDVMEPDDGEDLPDLVFVANAAVVRGKKAFLATFSNKERQGETALNRRWFERGGYEVHEDEMNAFEGAGDALFAGPGNGLLFCGIGPRSTTIALPKVAQALSTRKDQIKTVACRLVSQRFYHIDVAFCPLNESLALWHPMAFDDVAKHNLSNELKLIAVPDEEANNFACNAVVVNSTVIMNKNNPQTATLLRKNGYQAKHVDMNEFIKAGGSAKCCTLRLE
ncbi:hypothetical protein PENTCL1PPCAC_23393, partial [Pristionchus entomophagus]